MSIIFFTRMGGKSRIATKIISMFPSDYTTYVEPFAGGAKVFLSLDKKPNVKYVLSDTNKDIYDLWKDAQTINPEIVKQFTFPQSKQTFDFLKQQTNIKDKTKRFYRNLYVSFFSYSGSRVGYASKRSSKGLRFLQQFDRLHDYLKGVVILKRDYKKVIAMYDSPTTLFYLDPPYLGLEKYYEGQAIDPYELAEVCRTIKGKCILSYNITPEVRKAFKDFKIKKIPITYTALEKSKQKNEYVIMNY